jgi:hypothetical protein
MGKAAPVNVSAQHDPEMLKKGAEYEHVTGEHWVIISGFIVSLLGPAIVMSPSAPMAELFFTAELQRRAQVGAFYLAPRTDHPGPRRIF